MYLHSLTFQAIGPFDGIHTIDFSRLGASGLFLLEGPTGAGKSTIIDAIVFALYGGLAGEEASKQRLHSHHAAVGLEPFVDLTFSSQAGDYRIRRSPAHERPKRSGIGTTMQNESAKLSRLASLDAPDRGEEISTRAQEIGPEIKRIIGLDKQQFLQTVVLPQGEFAKFLRSTGEERKDLLRTIFRTDVYENLTEQLKAMRTAVRSSIDLARIRVGEALAGFRVAADFDEAIDDQDFVVVAKSCADVAATVAAAADQARQANDEAQLGLATARQHHDQQMGLARSLATRAQLIERTQHLAEATTQIDSLRARLEAAQRAASVVTSISGLRRATLELERVESGLQRAHNDYGDDAATIALEDLVNERERLSSEITELTRLLTIESGLASRRQSVKALRAVIVATRARIVALAHRTEAAPALVAKGEAEVARLAAAVQALPELRDRVERARKIAAAASALETISVRLAEESATRADLVKHANAANDELHALHQRQLDDYAGVLSSALIVGQPCAVCGSTEHPAPAVLQHDHPSDADFEAAERRLADLKIAAEVAAADVGAREQDLARKQEQSEGQDKNAATSALVATEQQLATGVAAEVDLVAARTALAGVKESLADDEAELTQAKVEVAGLEVEVAGLDEAITGAQAQIVEVLADRAPTLDALVGTLSSRRDAVDRFISARGNHGTATEALAQRQREVDEALANNQFDSVEAAEAADLDEPSRASITAQVKKHELESTRVADGLSQADIAALTGQEVTDVPSAEAALQVSVATAREAQTLSDVLDSRQKSTSRSLAEINGALEVHEAAITGSGAIVRLAGIAEGSHAANLKKVSLGTYVLMRRFDDVVNAANVRYAPMSNGRYQLLRIEENEGKGGGRRTGLALAIQDGETGRQREPRTLSGGETFNASLCLALGLADVVTGEAGGIELGTLFVDEGFGTLDAETLDRVMAELGKLSKGGRMVGVVSHVDELKHRIGDRIEVRHKAEGASTLTVRAEGEALVP